MGQFDIVFFLNWEKLLSFAHIFIYVCDAFQFVKSQSTRQNEKKVGDPITIITFQIKFWNHFLKSHFIQAFQSNLKAI